MAFPLGTALLVFVGTVTAYILIRFLRAPKYTYPLPPGPRGIPLLGNIKDLPAPGVLECHHWLKHKDLFGPISSITILGLTFVIVHDPDIALETMRDRASIYSGRPQMEFGGEMYVSLPLDFQHMTERYIREKWHTDE